MTNFVTTKFTPGYRLTSGDQLNTMISQINTGLTTGITAAANSWTAVQTYTNSDIKLLGSSTGKTTFTSDNAGATNYTLHLPAVTGAAAVTPNTTLWQPDLYITSGAVTKNANTTYATVTGLTATVVPGTYRVRAYLPSTVASGTGGIKYAFHYTTAVLSALEVTSRGYTASAVAVQHSTTTTDVSDLFTQAAVVILVELDGVIVVSTGGTISIQMAQNTSDASNTVALVNGYFELVRIA